MKRNGDLKQIHSVVKKLEGMLEEAGDGVDIDKTSASRIGDFIRDACSVSADLTLTVANMMNDVNVKQAKEVI